MREYIVFEPITKKAIGIFTAYHEAIKKCQLWDAEDYEPHLIVELYTKDNGHRGMIIPDGAIEAAKDRADTRLFDKLIAWISSKSENIRNYQFPSMEAERKERLNAPVVKRAKKNTHVAHRLDSDEFNYSGISDSANVGGYHLCTEAMETDSYILDLFETKMGCY